MTQRRRVTDRFPLSDAVTKVNLDDRLAAADEKMHGHWRLDDERWISHKEMHSELGASLRDYKRESNEWRQTVSDLRTTFMAKAEVQSELRRLEALIAAVDNRLDIIERAVQSINDTNVATRSLLSSGRNLIILAFTIIGGLIAVAVYFHGP